MEQTKRYTCIKCGRVFGSERESAWRAHMITCKVRHRGDVVTVRRDEAVTTDKAEELLSEYQSSKSASKLIVPDGFCPQCGGNGGPMGNCPRCGGNGFVEASVEALSGQGTSSEQIVIKFDDD